MSIGKTLKKSFKIYPVAVGAIVMIVLGFILGYVGIYALSVLVPSILGGFVAGMLTKGSVAAGAINAMFAAIVALIINMIIMVALGAGPFMASTDYVQVAIVGLVIGIILAVIGAVAEAVLLRHKKW